jgi:hypothetical protein
VAAADPTSRCSGVDLERLTCVDDESSTDGMIAISSRRALKSGAARTRKRSVSANQSSAVSNQGAGPVDGALPDVAVSICATSWRGPLGCEVASNR